MKWAYSIKNKTFASSILLILVAFIGFNNLLENRMANKMNSTLNEMYKDRLWAEYLISQIQYSMLKLKNCSNETDPIPELSRIAHLNQQFAQTSLTINEQHIFNDYISHCKKTLQNSSNFNHKPFSNEDFNQTEFYLQALNETQIKEGQILVTEMGNMHKSAALLSKFEITLLVLLGIIIQVLVLTSKSLKNIFASNYSMWN